MAKFPKAELLELFFQEVESYIPEIRQGLQILASDRTASTSIEELHRLYHNIKGAASQVQLFDLSKGAREVENRLEALLEEEQPISDTFLEALNGTADLLIEFCRDKKYPPDMEQDFHEQVVILLKGSQKEETAGSKQTGGNIDELQEYLHDVRTIFLLLQQLTGYLTEDGSDKEHDKMIYGKLSHAVSLLSKTVLAAGMRQQSLLMEDFHLLLEKLCFSEISHQPEMLGLMQDFLRFLEVAFAHEDPENSITIKRVKDQLQRFKAILVALGQKEDESAPVQEVVDIDALDFFDEPVADDESIDLMEELTDSDFFEESEEKPEGIEELAPSRHFENPEEEPVDEDQLLLMEIFREECDEHLIVINQSLNILEKLVTEPSALTPEIRASVSDMRRAVHTLKGAASMTGVELLAKGAHSLEDMLDWLNDQAAEINPQEVRVIATGIDVIELLSQSPQATESAGLYKLVDTITDYLASRSESENGEADSRRTGSGDKR